MDIADNDMGNQPSGKGKIILIFFTLIILMVMSGAGYIGVRQWWAKNQPRSSLGAIKISADVLKWAYGHVPELYVQMVALDDIILLFERELDRLKELAKTYPDQKAIVAEESEKLIEKKDELTNILTEAGKAIEAIYVTYKIDTRKGQNKIGSKEMYDLGKNLKATLKSYRGLVHRINSQNPQKWTDKIKEML